MHALVLFATLLGMTDNQARFHGLAEISLANGQKVAAVVRVEDLSHRAYSNRFHLIFETMNAEDLPGCATEWQMVTVTAHPASMQVSVAGWGSVTVWPLDPEVGRKFSEGTGASETRRQRVTVTRMDQGYYELLVEEPLPGR